MVKKLNTIEPVSPAIQKADGRFPGLSKCKPDARMALPRPMQNNLNLKLLYAVKKREWERAGKLLDAGAKAEARDRRGYSALTYAACEGKAELVEKMVNGGVEVSLEDTASRTAYIAAVVNKHNRVVELLQKHGDFEKEDAPALDSSGRGVSVSEVKYGGIVVGYRGVDSIEIPYAPVKM